LDVNSISVATVNTPKVEAFYLGGDYVFPNLRDCPWRLDCRHIRTVPPLAALTCERISRWGATYPPRRAPSHGGGHRWPACSAAKERASAGLRSSTAATASLCDKPGCVIVKRARERVDTVADRARPALPLNRYAGSVLSALGTSKCSVRGVGVGLGEGQFGRQLRVPFVKSPSKLSQLVESWRGLGDRLRYEGSIRIEAGAHPVRSERRIHANQVKWGCWSFLEHVQWHSCPLQP
jgi:hypothetical protein